MKRLAAALSVFLAVAFLLPAAGSGGPQATGPLPVSPVVDRGYLPSLLEMIEGAKDSISCLHLYFSYSGTTRQIQDALKKAAERGVKVRLILDADIDFNPRSAETLNESGIETALRPRIHSKLFVVDSSEVLLGSTNLSWSSIEDNHEANLRVKDPRVGAFFQDYFNRIWENREIETERLSLPGLEAVVNRAHFPILKKAFDDAREEILVVVYAMRYYPDYPDSSANRLMDSLIAARKRDVKVRVILDWSNFNETLNRINLETKKRLEAGGVEVRFAPEAVHTHPKLVIADSRALAGSLNWSYSSLDLRHESSLITSSPEAVEFFRNYFQQIWEKSSSREEISFRFHPAAALAATAWCFQRVARTADIAK